MPTPKPAELSPNVPDVAPDYVDLDGKPTAPEPVAEPPAPAAAPDRPPEYINMRCVHTLNAEIDHAEPATPAEKAPEAAPTLKAESAVAPEAEAAAPQPEEADLSPLAAASEPQAENQGFRDGECIPNIPDIAPDFVELNDELPGGEAETDKAADPGPLPPPPIWLRWSYGATVLVVAGLGVLVFSQAISSLALAATLPVWAQFLLLTPLIFCLLAVLSVCVALFRAWLKLREVQQVDLGALDELRRRAQTRKDAVEHFQEARRELELYLRTFPVDDGAAARFRLAGIDPAILGTLSKQREYLLERVTDSQSWLQEFRTHFQSGLDKAAASRVRGWALKAAGCVIASPLPLLDAALVLGISLKMIHDLALIYNVRGGRTATLILFTRAVVTAFVAGVAGDAADMAIGEASEWIGEAALGAMGVGAAKFVAPKLGEGAINAFFINRLGKATMRMLQPLRA